MKDFGQYNPALERVHLIAEYFPDSTNKTAEYSIKMSVGWLGSVI